MSKEELLERLNWRCKHGHNGIAHPACYANETHIVEKIGFLDIEFLGLQANYGILISWVIKPENSTKILFDCLRKKDKDDKRIVASCVVAMRQFDRLVGHYGKNSYCDVPYLRTRALKHNLDFPKYKEIYFTDVYPMAKNLLKLHSNRQACISEALRGITEKTRIKANDWLDAIMHRDKKSLNYILEHNIIDVCELEKNFHTLLPFVKLTKTSI